MKIHQLPPGARFEYEGEEYVKTGPLLGTGKGGQRLIPKYAVLKVQGTSEPMRDKQLTALSRAAVLAAFEKFYAGCEPHVAEEHREGMRAARADFLKALD